MYFFRFSLLLLLLSACGTDLAPSGTDRRPSVQCGITGPQVCQNAPDFTVSDSLGNAVTLSSVLSAPSTSGVVMYFTMWCPTCDSHMSYMQDFIIPANPHVVFYAVDYVSATVADARNAQVSNGFAGSGFVVLADTTNAALNEYNATMATTVVIDKNGVVKMNELFKTDKLQGVLGALP